MKKIFIIVVLIELITFIFPNQYISLATVTSQSKKETNNTNEIINSQKENLNISEFIKEAEKYTKESLPGVDLNDLLSTAISGNIDNSKLLNMLWRLVGKEVLNSAGVLASIIVIVVIHGILKNISEGLGNKSVAQVAYYVQYIMIVALVMTSFSEIINMVKTSIQNLVSFINLLIPILITLMVTTGCITSAGMLEPIILFMITIIGNFIVNVVIPIVLVSTALGIISQMSDKIQNFTSKNIQRKH